MKARDIKDEETELTAIYRRLRSLERDRLVLLCMMILGCIVFTVFVWCKGGHRKTVVAGHFVLVDEEGRTRATLSMDTFDDAPCLELLDSQGWPRIGLGLSEHDTPGLAFGYEENSVHVLSKAAFLVKTNYVKCYRRN